MDDMEVMEHTEEKERDAVTDILSRTCTEDAIQEVQEMFENITSSPFDFEDEKEEHAAVVLFVKRRLVLFSRMMQAGLIPDKLSNLVYLSHFASIELGMKDVFAYLVDVCGDDDLRGAMRTIYDDVGELDDEWNITARSCAIKKEVEKEG